MIYLIIERKTIVNDGWFTSECIGYANVEHLMARVDQWKGHEGICLDSDNWRMRIRY